ncbi:MAG: glycosyltransferase family 4 protein [Gemmatimonadaceae bacterium]
MKIALIVPGGVDRTGIDRVVPALLWQIERLARRHKVHVFAMSQEPEPAHWELLGATVHNVGVSGARRRRYLSWFMAEHRREPFDVVHAFWGGSAMHAVAAAWWYRIPYVLHLAGGELVALRDIGYGGRRTWKGRMTLRASLAAARRVSVATGYMQRLARACGCEAEQIPLGVALDRWPVLAPRERDTSRPVRLLHIGDLRPVKDQALLLRTAALLRGSGVAFSLDIAGYDTMDGAMQALAAQLGLAPSVRWHGLLRREGLRALVEQADILVVTSRHDAGPLVVLEAAIAGVPTVGTAVGHVADWAPDAAVSIPDGGEAALAGAITDLIADEPRRIGIAREAQRRAIEIDADYTAACFEHIYDDVTKSSRSRFAAN